MSNKVQICGLKPGCKASCDYSNYVDGIPLKICSAEDCPETKTYTLSLSRNRSKKEFKETYFGKEA